MERDCAVIYFTWSRFTIPPFAARSLKICSAGESIASIVRG
jgi:hypothetical protein